MLRCEHSLRTSRWAGQLKPLAQAKVVTGDHLVTASLQGLSDEDHAYKSAMFLCPFIKACESLMHFFVNVLIFLSFFNKRSHIFIIEPKRWSRNTDTETNYFSNKTHPAVQRVVMFSEWCSEMQEIWTQHKYVCHFMCSCAGLLIDSAWFFFSWNCT